MATKQWNKDVFLRQTSDKTIGGRGIVIYGIDVLEMYTIYLISFTRDSYLFDDMTFSEIPFAIPFIFSTNFGLLLFVCLSVITHVLKC